MTSSAVPEPVACSRASRETLELAARVAALEAKIEAVSSSAAAEPAPSPAKPPVRLKRSDWSFKLSEGM